jgi:hypothetical protein
MARSRVPTSIPAARGAFAGKPRRRQARGGEPIVTEPTGDPPEHLTATQRTAWYEAGNIVSDGALTRADRFSVEMAACLLVGMRTEDRLFATTRMAKLRYLLGSFGRSCPTTLT